MELNDSQVERYSRNIVLAELGPSGQHRLRQSSVLIVGAGGLGSPAALYLAAAGIGSLGLVDPDVVALSNLQRQVLHDTGALGQPKIESAVRRLAALNPEVQVDARVIRLQADNAREMLSGYDFVIDGSDNFPTKFLVNDVCVIAGKPFSHAGALGFRGQALTWVPGAGGACLRCLMPLLPSPEESPTCAQSGVLGAAVGIIGSIQAAEAIKVLCGIGEPLAGRLLTVDSLGMTFRTVRAKADPGCPVCSAHPSITELDERNYS